MKTKKLLSFKEHINQVMRPHKIWMPSLFALAMAFVSFYAILLFYSHADKNLANILAPHISSLLEVQDGSEIHRLINSVAVQKSSRLKIIQNGTIVESTLSTERFNPYKEGHKEGYSFLNIPSLVSSKYLTSEAIIARDGGPKNWNAKLILQTPIGGIISIPFVVALVTFALIFFIVRFVTQKSLKAMQKSILPINLLDKAIKDLQLMDTENKIPSFEIREFENMAPRRNLWVESRDNMMLHDNTRI